MHRTALIFNPTAGGSRGKKFFAELRQRHPDLKLAATAAPGDAEKFAAQLAAEGYDPIVAGGGDGTINAVINGLATHATNSKIKTTFGVLPTGTQNVFACELKISNKLSEAWKIIEQGKTRVIDLARVSYEGVVHASETGGRASPRADDVKSENGSRELSPSTRFFVQLAGVGFDARAVEGVDLDWKKVIGPLEYVLAGLRAATEPAPHLTIQANGVSLEGTFVVIGNGRYYGGPFALFPSAVNDDGKFDVVLFQRGGYLDYLRYFQGVLRGVHTDFPDVKYFTTQRLSVTSPNPVPLEADGELLGHTPAEFDLWPQALKVLVP